MVDHLVAVGDDLVLPLSVKLYANQLLGTMSLDSLPAGSVGKVNQSSDGSWPARPTVRTGVMILWIGYPGLTSLPSDFLAGVDAYWHQAA